MSKRHRNNDWAAPSLPPQAYATADTWGEDVDVRRFARTLPSPAVRLVVQTDLSRSEVERLIAEVLDAIIEGDGGE